MSKQSAKALLIQLHSLRLKTFASQFEVAGILYRIHNEGLYASYGFRSFEEFLSSEGLKSCSVWRWMRVWRAFHALRIRDRTTFMKVGITRLYYMSFIINQYNVDLRLSWALAHSVEACAALSMGDHYRKTTRVSFQLRVKDADLLEKAIVKVFQLMLKKGVENRGEAIALIAAGFLK